MCRPTLSLSLCLVMSCLSVVCVLSPAGEFDVNVEAEPNFEGALVLLEPPRDRALVPFAGERVVSCMLLHATMYPAHCSECKVGFSSSLSFPHPPQGLLWGFFVLRAPAHSRGPSALGPSPPLGVFLVCSPS